MHTGPMPDSAGTFDGARPVDRPCPKCGNKTVTVRMWESNDGAYEDERYDCLTCQYRWWVEGIDS